MHGVHVLGLVYTEESVVRSFSRGEHLVLNVNLTDPDNFGIRLTNVSLFWYHNETKLLAGNKYVITNNTKTLTISDMTGSDAGVYEVKIDLRLSSDENQDCDSSILESHALFAPVTFTVQEQSLPEYNPSSIISTYYINRTESDAGYNVELREDIQLNNDDNYRSNWYRNSTQLYNGDMYSLTITNQGFSLRITSNFTADVIGDYVGILWTRRFRQCGYFFFGRRPIHKITFWSIKLSSEL